MTLVHRTVNIIEHFEELFRNKFFKTLFLTVFVSFFIFTTLGIYAQEELTDIKISTEKAWGEEQKFINTLQGVEPGSEDVTTMQTNSTLATLHVVASKVCVSCFENGEEIAGSGDISDELKMGVLEIVDNGVIAMLENPPGVNIPSHLAKEWVPGYDSSNTSIYAVGGHLSGYVELQLSGVDVLWGRVRNIAYVMFVIIMIVIGFMIMFRTKLGGQTMVTIGNAIPNVIIALVLVTFSFAIAGLIIDLGGLILIFISSIYTGSSTPDYTQFVGISGPFEIFKIVITGKGRLIQGFAGGAGITGLVTGLVAGIVGVASITGPGVIAGVVVGGITVVLFFLVIAGIVGYGAIKLWIMLLKSYVTILLQVIGAPLIIMSSALPGKMKAFTNWMKGIAKNVLVFPATFALINLPNALLGSSGDIKLRLPGALIYEDASTYTTSGGTNLTSQFFVVILEIVLIYVASQIPAFLETILPSNSSPAMQKAGEKSKEALSKMPIMGSLFGGK